MCGTEKSPLAFIPGTTPVFVSGCSGMSYITRSGEVDGTDWRYLNADEKSSLERWQAATLVTTQPEPEHVAADDGMQAAIGAQHFEDKNHNGVDDAVEGYTGPDTWVAGLEDARYSMPDSSNYPGEEAYSNFPEEVTLAEDFGNAIPEQELGNFPADRSTVAAQAATEAARIAGKPGFGSTDGFVLLGVETRPEDEGTRATVTTVGFISPDLAYKAFANYAANSMGLPLQLFLALGGLAMWEANVNAADEPNEDTGLTIGGVDDDNRDNWSF